MKINRKQLRKFIMENINIILEQSEQGQSENLTYTDDPETGWAIYRDRNNSKRFKTSAITELTNKNGETLNVSLVVINRNNRVFVRTENPVRSMEVNRDEYDENYFPRYADLLDEYNDFRMQTSDPEPEPAPEPASRDIESITYTGNKSSGWEYENNTNITGGNNAPGGGYFIAVGRISIKKGTTVIYVSQIQVFKDGSMAYVDRGNNNTLTYITSEDFSSYNVPSFEEIEGMRPSNERDQNQQPSQPSVSTQSQDNQRRSGNSKVKEIQKIIGADPDGIWGPETNEKLLEYTKALVPGQPGPRKAVIVNPTMPGQSLWKNWKENAPKVKSIKVGTSARGQKTMTFGPDAGNPAMKGNLTDLLKVLEFIRDARAESVNESLSHGALIRRRYRRY